jgi:hypothetical protein
VASIISAIISAENKSLYPAALTCSVRLRAREAHTEPYLPPRRPMSPISF